MFITYKFILHIITDIINKISPKYFLEYKVRESINAIFNILVQLKHTALYEE